MDSVTSNRQETKADILCKCPRSGCVQYGCKCFLEELYCDEGCRCDNCQNKRDLKDTGGGNSSSSSSDRHKKGCQCKKIKCKTKSCVCYRVEVGCSKRCRCRLCANSFGKKPEPMLLGAEYWKNRSRKMRNMEELMSNSTKVGTAVPSMPNRSQKMPNMSEIISDSTKVGTANQLSPTQEKLTDMNHPTVSTHSGSSANVPQAVSTHSDSPIVQNVSHNMDDIGVTIGDDLNRLFSSSNNRGMMGYGMYDIDETMGDDLNRLFSTRNNPGMMGYGMYDIDETMGDDLNRLFSISNNREMRGYGRDDLTMGADLKRLFSMDDISDMFEDSNPTKTMKSESAVQPTAASVPCSPTPATCCNTEDRTSQTEIHHDK